MRLRTPAGRANPYPIYGAIQDVAPVLRWRGVWSLTRHRHVSLVKDPRFVIGRRTAERDDRRVSQDFVLFLDPPDHDRVRAVVTHAINPSVVDSWRPRVVAIVEGLVASLERRPSFDLVADFAHLLPVRVICELLALPPEGRDDFIRWSRALAPTFDRPSPAERAAADEASNNMREALTAVVASRRRTPGDDVVSSLLAASDQGDSLSSEELLANLILFFFAGHDTTTNLIANGMLALLQHRDQWELLTAEPSIARAAVEEALRFDSPVQATSRHTTEEIEVEGHRIKAGERVTFVLGAANRDPEVFPEPHSFDISRPNASRHFAFGSGGHYCVGAPLARLEAELAFSTLATAFPRLQPVDTKPEWRDGFILRGMKAFHVKT